MTITVQFNASCRNYCTAEELITFLQTLPPNTLITTEWEDCDGPIIPSKDHITLDEYTAPDGTTYPVVIFDVEHTR